MRLLPARHMLRPGPALPLGPTADADAGLLEIDALVLQGLGDHTMVLAKLAQEDVLGSDVVVARPGRLVRRALQAHGAPGIRRSRSRPERSEQARAHGFELQALLLQDFGDDTLVLAEQTEQEVLGAEVVVA